MAIREETKLKRGDIVEGIGSSNNTGIGATMKVLGVDEDDGELKVRVTRHRDKPSAVGYSDWIDIGDVRLTKIIVKMKKVKYKPGQSITDYIKNILKTEKDKERLKWLKTFDNCILPDDVKETIEEALTTVLRKDVFEKWGVYDHFEKGITNSILIYGPPGTGKTMVSESIASVLGKNLMKVSSADIQSPLPGRTEKNIIEAFAQAKREDAVLLFDECDSILYNRNAVGMILAAEINALLTEIERFEGVVILTTNRLHRLDDALQRRIIARVHLGKPNLDARKQIWKKLIPPKVPLAGKIDYGKLAKFELTGGDIKNCVLLAIRKAVARNEKKVTMQHFLVASQSVQNAKEDFERVKPKPYAQGVDKVMAE